MRLQTLLEATRPFVEKPFDPALMTFEEYINAVNRKGEWHDHDAYDSDVSEREIASANIKDFPILLQQITRKGIKFEVRMEKEDVFKTKRYGKYDEEGNPLREPNGDLIYMTYEELKEKYGEDQYDYQIGIFEDDKCVARYQDEWGCVLIRVSRAFRDFGLGQVLKKFQMELEPGKPSGGFTQSGYDMNFKFYTNAVKDYLESGFYSDLIRQGKITKARVREILISADLEDEKTNISPIGHFNKTDINLNTKVSSDWLMMIGDDSSNVLGEGGFVVYDKKVKSILNSKYEDNHLDRFLKAAGNILIYGTKNEYSRFITFGAESQRLGEFLVILGLHFANICESQLYLEEDQIKYASNVEGIAVGEKNLESGMRRYPVSFTEEIDPKVSELTLTKLGQQEWDFRKSFDRYDEFGIRIAEESFRKFGK